MEFTINGSRYEVEEEVGRGAFGTVYKVREPRSDQVFAVKEIEVEFEYDRQNVEKEINTLKKCDDHEGIVKLYDVDYTSQSVLIRIEFCSGGNLNSRLGKATSITASERDKQDLRCMSELADAVRFLHSKEIVHRDLKPENVLLTSTDAIKLGDFGLAREYTALKQGESSDEAYVRHVTKYYYMTSACGTPAWMAPEVFEGHYTEKADVFSLGCIFYSILVRSYISFRGEKFFGVFVTSLSKGHDGIGHYMFNRPHTNYVPPFDKISDSRREVIIRMLKYDAKQRPSAENVHDEVENIRKNEIEEL